MSWIFVAILAYLLLAIANLFDKFLVDRVLPSSKAYAFVACFFGGIVILGAPWLLEWPGTDLVIVNLISGAIFAIALWFLYEALRRGEASQTLVFVGGLTPVFSISFSVLFFKEQYTNLEWIGIITLLLGILIVAALPKERHFLTRFLHKLKIASDFKSTSLFFAFGSAFFYSVYFLLTKFAYSGQTFASAFIWNRLGAALFVLLFLINKKDRKIILKTFHSHKKSKNGLLVILNQGLGSLGFILQNYAIFLGSVALVNALQGVQYAFLLVISSVLAVLSPRLLKENFSWRIFSQKLLAVIVIAFGLYFILA